MEKPEIAFGKAKATDALQIKAIIDAFANTNDVLPRALSEIHENIRDYFIAKIGGEIIGCIGLHFIWDDIAELRSLAVKKEHQGNGIGSRLVELAMYEAKVMDVKKLMAFTYSPGFFKKFRFDAIERKELPPIIFADSLKCPKYPNCDCTPIMSELTHIE